MIPIELRHTNGNAYWCTAKLHYPKNLKQIFPEMKLLSLIPNFHIYVSVKDQSVNAMKQNRRQTNCGNIKNTQYQYNFKARRPFKTC